MTSKSHKKDQYTLLPKLGTAIDRELASWEAHYTKVEAQPTYDSILAEDIKNPTIQMKALVHLLYTLPIRHAILAASYDDPGLALIEHSAVHDRLLEELDRRFAKLEAMETAVVQETAAVQETIALQETAAGDDNKHNAEPSSGKASSSEASSAENSTLEPSTAKQSPEDENMDIVRSFRRMFAGKKFTADVLESEKALCEVEKARGQDLRMLKAYHQGLMDPVRKDDELEVEHVEMLMDTMEAMGVLLVGPGFRREGSMHV